MNIDNLENNRLYSTQPVPGNVIEFDDGATYTLFPCDNWDKASFRVRSKFYNDIVSAINVEITGRRVYSRGRNWRVRCKIEVVGDCEPSSFYGGWLYLYINDIEEVVR